MGRQTYYFNTSSEHRITTGFAQNAAIRVNVQADVYDYSSIPHKFVAVNLNGTSVAASTTDQLGVDRTDKRGYFTEWIETTIALSGSDFAVAQDSPVTDMGSQTTTSTTGLSINESLGTFGPVPTTSTSAGVTIGSSFSKNLRDFRIVNKSSNTAAVHRYALAATSGGAYEWWHDLVDLSPAGQWKGSPLFHPPELAIANLPIISQAIFISNRPDPADPTLTVSIVHHLVAVEKTFQVVKVHSEHWEVEWERSVTERLPMKTSQPATP